MLVYEVVSLAAIASPLCLQVRLECLDLAASHRLPSWTIMADALVRPPMAELNWALLQELDSAHEERCAALI